MNSGNSTKILGVRISRLGYNDTLELFKKWLIKSGGVKFVVTPNPEFLVKAQKDKEFKEVLNGADLAIPDGSKLIWASKRVIKERVSGTDLLISLCGVCEEMGLTVGLIGGAEKVAVKTGECLKKRLSRLKVIVIQYPVTNDQLPMTNFNFKNIDVLFVALGMGKQERWIYNNKRMLEKVGVRLAMGVGGAFDYISGVVPRAPKLVRDHGFEWLFRLIVQPWRLKRQLALFEFVRLVYVTENGKVDFGLVPFTFRAIFGK